MKVDRNIFLFSFLGVFPTRLIYHRVDRTKFYRARAEWTEESRVVGHKLRVIARSLALDVPVGRIKSYIPYQYRAESSPSAIEQAIKRRGYEAASCRIGSLSITRSNRAEFRTCHSAERETSHADWKSASVGRHTAPTCCSRSHATYKIGLVSI